MHIFLDNVPNIIIGQGLKGNVGLDQSCRNSRERWNAKMRRFVCKLSIVVPRPQGQSDGKES